MLYKPLRQAIQSPLPTILDGLRFWRQNRSRIHRARVLCQCADGLRLRRVPAWEIRSSRVYHRAADGLRELAPFENDAEASWAEIAHRTLVRAQAPIRALVAGVVVLAGALALVATIILALGCAVSPNLRGRLFPRDLAAGKPWTSSSAAFGYPTSGVGPSSEGPFFFHSSVGNNPFVEIDLGAEHTIRNIEVENRTDCCNERALPLDVKVLKGGTWQLVAERRAWFSTWKYDITPVRAQKIRFERPGSDLFHLKRISVYGQ